MALIGQAIAGHQMSKMNRELQLRSQAFSAQQSNTQYQRAMGDMRAAGLNPMLAYMQGGNTAMQGASGTMGNPSSPGGIGDDINSALSIKQAWEGVKLTKQQTQTDASRMADMDYSAEQHKRQADLALAQMRYVQTQDRMLKYDEPYKKFQAEMDTNTAGKVGRGVERLKSTVNPFHTGRNRGR